MNNTPKEPTRHYRGHLIGLYMLDNRLGEFDITFSNGESESVTVITETFPLTYQYLEDAAILFINNKIRIDSLSKPPGDGIVIKLH